MALRIRVDFKPEDSFPGGALLPGKVHPGQSFPLQASVFSCAPHWMRTMTMLWSWADTPAR